MIDAGASILVTGGAGYIGSHTVKALAERGARPIVFDNLTSGHREALQWGDFIEGDIRDGAALEAAMERYGVSAVIHFAGLSEVARSLVAPEVAGGSGNAVDQAEKLAISVIFSLLAGIPGAKWTWINSPGDLGGIGAAPVPEAVSWRRLFAQIRA